MPRKCTKRRKENRKATTNVNKVARVLVNLGTPEEPTPECAEDFLFEFLSDKNVLSIPQPFRSMLALFISKKRKHFYAKMLQRVFENKKHILKKHTENLAKKISELDGNSVYVAYRYGNDNITQIIKKLKSAGYEKFLFIPMYPQKTCSTTDTIIEEIERVLEKSEFKVADAYFDNPIFIESLASTLPKQTETLIVSFHSIPIEHANKSPYVEQCKRTVNLLAKKNNICDIHLAWQSAMPKGKWLKPSVIDVVEKLINDGKKSITIIAPSFACDCSETIFELGEDLKAHFFKLGGKQFNLCQSLNSSYNHALLFSNIFKNLENSL